jgi:hypothetical protein
MKRPLGYTFSSRETACTALVCLSLVVGAARCVGGQIAPVAATAIDTTEAALCVGLEGLLDVEAPPAALAGTAICTGTEPAFDAWVASHTADGGSVSPKVAAAATPPGSVATKARVMWSYRRAVDGGAR